MGLPAGCSSERGDRPVPDRDGPAEGAAALTRRRVGRGAAWYVSTQPDAQGLARVLGRILAEAGAAPAVTLPADHPAVIAGEVDAVRRGTAGRSWLLALNHSATEVTLPVRGHDLVSQTDVDGELRLAAGGYAVVREE